MNRWNFSHVPPGDDRYWFSHENAMNMARFLARQTGVRHRVQRVSWLGVPNARWFVAPTPAPAPEAVS